MTSSFQTFGEGASTNRPPLFASENYPFWKIRMQIFLESQDKGTLDATMNGPYVPTKTVDSETVLKPFTSGLLMKIEKLSMMLKLEI